MTHEKSISEARINYNSHDHEASKKNFLDLILGEKIGPGLGAGSVPEYLHAKEITMDTNLETPLIQPVVSE